MNSQSSVVRRQTLQFSYVEGSFYAVMVALAESFALYFAVLRGLSATEVALISTVPMTLGAVAHWLVPQLIPDRWLKSGLIVCLLVQILGLGFLVTSTQVENHFRWAMAALSLYWIGQMGGSPLWFEWISGWMPAQRFGRFVARRNSFLALVTLVLFWSGAFVLTSLPDWSGFVWLFSVGLLARIISTILLYLQESPPAQAVTQRTQARIKDRWPFWGVVAVILFATLFKCVANIGSPFFLPYMVHELKFNAFQISLINGMAFMGLALLMTSYGEAMKTFQPLMGLQVAMFMAAINCLLWLYFSDPLILCLLQIFSGLYWAGFDLACVLILQAQFPQSFRKVLGIHLCLTNLASILGGLLGSYVQSEGLRYLDLFEISGLLRLALAIGFLVLMFRLKNFKVSWTHYRDFLREAAVPRLTFMEFNRIFPRSKKNDSKRP